MPGITDKAGSRPPVTRQFTLSSRHVARPSISHKPEVLILSERNARAYQPSGREVCISVRDPDAEVPPLSDRFVATLRLTFNDITEPTGLDHHVVFDEVHAKAVVRFVSQWAGVDRIVIQCRGGFGRSPGLAIGLCELFSWASTSALEKQHPLWNKRVRREVVRVGRAVLQQTT